LEDFEANYKENESVDVLREKAAKLNEALTIIEKALYQTQNRSHQVLLLLHREIKQVKKNIEDKLNPEFEGRFKVMMVPNITNICYGRGVGYKIEEIVLSDEIQKISATKIRAKMREDGDLK
jgi:hypothetical protein